MRDFLTVLGLLLGPAFLFASHAKHARQPQAQALSPSADVDPAELALYEKIETQYRASFYFPWPNWPSKPASPWTPPSCCKKPARLTPSRPS